MHPRPLPSVIAPLESIQYRAGCKLSSPMRFWPSPSWPSLPEAPPEEVRLKQQLSVRPTRALEPAAKTARVMKFLIVAVQQMWIG